MWVNYPHIQEKETPAVLCYVVWREKEEDMRLVENLKLSRKRRRGIHKERWKDSINSDIRWMGLQHDDTQDRTRWCAMVKLETCKMAASAIAQRNNLLAIISTFSGQVVTGCCKKEVKIEPENPILVILFDVILLKYIYMSSKTSTHSG